jgi:uncharacterized protein (DUF362 family)/NAD-dependent dihydropyrimidine dehydrogenase PreA subunit
MAHFVRPGQTVLVKPNLLTDRRPDDAVTTHPELVRALVRCIREAGASPVVADSPAGATRLETVWETTGLARVCAEENVPLENLEKGGATRFEIDGCTFHIAQRVLDADALINVPKVKTHVLTTLTAGVKNLYGAVPGYQKALLHKTHPRPDEFAALIRAIHKVVRPVLNVADGVVGMEGDGPSGGRPVSLGVLAASPDACALDLALCRLLRIDPRSVPYLRGSEGHEPVLVGDPLPMLQPATFALPATTPLRFVPRWVIRRLEPFLWIRPDFRTTCTRCGRCSQACPASALQVQPGERPVLDPSRCIGCCCCHEVCPAQAITMTQSLLLNLMRGGQLPQ